MIDEKKLIEIFEERMQDDNVMNPIIKVIDVLEIIEEQPKVNEWIHIGQYPLEPSLLCFEDGSMAVGYIDEWEGVCVCDYDCYYTSDGMPIAYMPLPQAYKGE